MILRWESIVLGGSAFRWKTASRGRLLEKP